MLRSVMMILACCALGVASCNATGNQEPSPAGNQPSTSPTRVARIVFVDQKEACDCTRTRINTSWESLNAVLKDAPKIPVERILLDTEKEKAAPYIEMETLMVSPGIYFLDEKGKLVELLQGEVREDQIAQLLI